MQADGRIGVYMIGGRDGCTPMPVPDPFANDMFDVFFEADEMAIPQMLERNDPTKSRVFPYCLSDVNGPGTFYINYDPFTSSLLKRTKEFEFTQWYVGRDYPHTETMRTVREVPVELRTLDSLHLLDDPAVAPPSIIVLDTQGTELAIMRGGRDLISEHTMAIVTEAEFVRFYDGQPLFGDICSGARRAGIHVCRLHRRACTGAISFRVPLGFRSRTMAGYCDALFLRKPASNCSRCSSHNWPFVAQLYAQMGYGFHCLDLLLKTDPQLKCHPGRTRLPQLSARTRCGAPGDADRLRTGLQGSLSHLRTQQRALRCRGDGRDADRTRDAEYAKIRTRLAAQKADSSRCSLQTTRRSKRLYVSTV